MCLQVRSAMWKIACAIPVLVLLLQDCSTQSQNYTCDDEDYSCTSCFNKIAHELLSSSNNQLELQRVFFPPDKSTPIFVIVRYHYSKKSFDYAGDMALEMEPEVWFWSAYTYYILFSPLEVH